MSPCGFKRGIVGKYIIVVTFAVIAIILITSGLIFVNVFCAGASAQEATSPIACTANTLQGTVSVIDMNDNAIFGTVFNISSPTGVAIDANDSRLYVTNGIDNTVTIVDLRSYSAVGTINVGNDPVNIAISPDSHTLYVANYGSNSLSIINVSQNIVNGTVMIGTEPSSIRINPVNGDVYVSSAADSEVWVVRGNTKIATIRAGKWPVKGMAVTPDGSLLFIIDSDNDTVSAFNTTTFNVVNTVSVGNSPDGIDISPDGLYAFISNPGSGNISIMQLSDSSIRVSFSAYSPGAIALRPTDGRMAYILSVPAGNVTAMDSTTGDVKAVFNISATSIRTALVNSNLLVDTIPPVTTMHVTGINDSRGWYIGQAICNLTAIDYPGGADDKNIQYSLDGLNWLQYDGGNITFSTPGEHYVYYRAADSSGNVEHVRSSLVIVESNSSDTTPTPGPATVLPPKPTALPPEDIPSYTPDTAAGQATPASTPVGGFELALAAVGMSVAIFIVYCKYKY